MKSPFGEGRSRRAAPSLKGALGAQPRRGGQWRVPAGPQLYANAPGAARPPRPAPPRRMPVPPDGRGGPSTPLRRLARPAEGGVRGSDGPRRPPPPRSPPFVPGVAQLYANNEHKGARGGGGGVSLACRPRAPRPPQRARRGRGGRCPHALPARRRLRAPRSCHLRGSSASPPRASPRRRGQRAVGAGPQPGLSPPRLHLPHPQALRARFA